MPTDSSIGRSAFPTTLWTSLLDPIRNDCPDAEAAVERLCRSYWRPIHGYVLRRGFFHHEAEDITQDFLTALLRRDAFAAARREHGRFRAFIIASLKNFIANRIRASHAQRRGGGAIHESIDEGTVANVIDPAASELEFHRDWASSLLQSTLQSLAEEYRRADKANVFAALSCFLPGGETAPSREETVTRLGMTSNSLGVAIHRLRRRYGDLLREAVAGTVDRPEDVKAELEALMLLFKGP